MATYNRMAAVVYAITYARFPNQYFYRMFERGDCTNFVSQALWAGGWPMLAPNKYLGFPVPRDLGWYATPEEDSYNTVAGWMYKYDYTRSWIGATAFKTFIQISRRCIAKTRFEMELGDVVQIAVRDGTPDGGDAHHTMIVTRKEPPSAGAANLWLTYHDANKINTPLAYVESTTSVNQQLIFWKVQDHIAAPHPAYEELDTRLEDLDPKKTIGVNAWKALYESD